jgi:hypothetical protein
MSGIYVMKPGYVGRVRGFFRTVMWSRLDIFLFKIPYLLRRSYVSGVLVLHMEYTRLKV